jgi:hypothetical protein
MKINLNENEYVNNFIICLVDDSKVLLRDKQLSYLLLNEKQIFYDIKMMDK